ncbi:MAG TPA: hypothetical protein VGB36_06040, partial [Gammaproteobacteria bacterium]
MDTLQEEVGTSDVRRPGRQERFQLFEARAGLAHGCEGEEARLPGFASQIRKGRPRLAARDRE